MVRVGIECGIELIQRLVAPVGARSSTPASSAAAAYRSGRNDE